jgi:hypothetical protein
MRIVIALLTIVLAAPTALAQQGVPLPPQPPADKPPAAPQPAAPAPAANGPSLEVTMKFIQDKVNEQGMIIYIQNANDTNTGAPITLSGNVSVESSVTAVDLAGGLSLQESVNQRQTITWRVYFKDIGKLEVLNSTDYKHRINPVSKIWVDDPPYFEIVVHLAGGKTVQQHTRVTAKSETPKHAAMYKESDVNVKEFALHFHDEETANRVAKAMIHAVELCGGGSQPEPF